MMKQTYIKPAVTVVKMEGPMLLESLSNPESERVAPEENLPKPDVPGVGGNGGNGVVYESKGHSSWGTWDDYPSQGSLWD